ncbi:uncharacterized protein LOC134683999 [Mytilus trossulus]|uniref:uncharacterized protein LOC134683999 n=1 Tax=Mytilus trossulus TaxID=6551 RepID=UPI00300700AC
MLKIENMAGLTARIGRHFLKLRKPYIRHNLRHFSYIKTFKDIFTKKGTVITTVAAGCIATSIAGYVVYTKKQNYSDGCTSKATFQNTNNKLEFETYPRGKIIGEVNIEVGPTGTTVECRTDLDNGTNHEKFFESFKNDKYKFIRQNKHNPKVTYNKETDISTIGFYLLDINE